MTALKFVDKDTSFRPQDDLYRHVNGTWLANHEIPADRARDGGFRMLFDAAEEHVKEIIQNASPEGDGAKIAAVYSSFMDTERINATGISALDPDLALLRGVTDRAVLSAAMGSLQRVGIGSAIGLYVNNDAGDPTTYSVYFTQSGLGLPDEAYYREESHADVVEAYIRHIEQMFTISGLSEDPAATAARVFNVEKALAAGHWDTVSARDAQKSYNPTTPEELLALAPGFDWAAWSQALGSQEILDNLIVRQPSFIEIFNEVFSTTDLEALIEWQTWHILSGRAAYLHDEIVEENFDFYGRTLTGAQELRERWKRGGSLTESILGEAIGKVYVAQHFPPTYKQAMDGLVADLIAAYDASISQLDWMGEETRKKALKKLASFTPKIGYPDKWRDYSTLITSNDLVANVRSGSEFETDFELGKLGAPIDRTEWFMTPQTVNAYFNPVMNEIVFPAAILQPPFFFPDGPAAANFGGIGAVIGHEIGHGFDDQGSRYDGEGRLTDWWTAEDREEFTARTTALIDQYDALSPAQLNGSHHVNGAFTIGENIGDLGGLGISIQAYRIARARGVDADLDETEALRLLFSSYARIWKMKARDAEAIRLLSIDPHSPEEFRCNQVVKNIDEFHEVFNTTPEDNLWLAPGERVKIW